MTKIFAKFIFHNRIINWSDLNNKYWYECSNKCLDLEAEITYFTDIVIEDRLWKLDK